MPILLMLTAIAAAWLWAATAAIADAGLVAARLVGIGL